MAINLTDAVVFGIIVLIMGGVTHVVLGNISQLSVQLPPVCKDWNKYHVMEISLFVTGFLSYIVFKKGKEILKK